MVDTGEVYLRTKAVFASTITEASERALATKVPASPAWTVRDVLCHVVGLSADLNAQRFPADPASSDLWTDAQVSQRRTVAVSDVLTEWDQEAPRFTEGLRLFGYEMGSHFVADLQTHLQDVRGALALPRADDPVTVAVSLDHYLGFVDSVIGAASWGELTVTAGSEQHVLGRGSARASVAAPPFELLRTFSARRSLAQVRALDWRGEVDGFLTVLAGELGVSYAFPAADLIE